MSARRDPSPKVRKQAGLVRLAPLLDELRGIDALKESSPGIFRLRSKAFLHFHYHPTGDIVADVRMSGRTDIGGGWTRFDVTESSGWPVMLDAVTGYVSGT